MAKNAFVDYLCGLGKDPGTVPEMYPYVVPFTTKAPGWEEQNHYLVAALFASHPEHDENLRSLGVYRLPKWDISGCIVK
jgi:hypothetical protein